MSLLKCEMMSFTAIVRPKHQTIQTIKLPQKDVFMRSHFKNQAIILSEEQSAVVCGAWPWCALPAGPSATGQWGHGGLGHEIKTGWGWRYPGMYLSQMTQSEDTLSSESFRKTWNKGHLQVNRSCCRFTDWRRNSAEKWVALSAPRVHEPVGKVERKECAEFPACGKRIDKKYYCFF